MKSNGLAEIKVVVIVAILVIVLAAPFIVKLVGVNSKYSTGERTGVVTKISQKGYFWKTWEGEMNLGGISDSGGGIIVSNVWRFSVMDDELALKLRRVAAAGALRITLKYTEVWKASFAQGETDYFITNARPASLD